MDTPLLMIGELAEKVGVTIRTLQYYDRIELLKSTSSAGGRRMYTRNDLFRLQQILFLKSFGFSLQQIRNHLHDHTSNAELTQIFVRQRDILNERVKNLSHVVDQLDLLLAEIQVGQEVSVSRIMAIMELMKDGNPYEFVIHYLGNEQLRTILQRFESAAESRKLMNQMTELTIQAQALHRQQTDPQGEEGQALARDWWGRVKDLGGDRR